MVEERPFAAEVVDVDTADMNDSNVVELYAYRYVICLCNDEYHHYVYN